MRLSRKPVILALPFHGKACRSGLVRRMNVSLGKKQQDCQQSAIRLWHNAGGTALAPFSITTGMGFFPTVCFLPFGERHDKEESPSNDSRHRPQSAAGTRG